MPRVEKLSWRLNKRKIGRLQLFLNPQPRDLSSKNQGLEDSEVLGVRNVESPTKELIML